jgi:hypothetical protein
MQCKNIVHLTREDIEAAILIYIKEHGYHGEKVEFQTTPTNITAKVELYAKDVRPND